MTLPARTIVLVDNIFYYYYDGQIESNDFYRVRAVWKDDNGKFWMIDPKDSDWSDYGTVYNGRDIKIVKINVKLPEYNTPSKDRHLLAL